MKAHATARDVCPPPCHHAQASLAMPAADSAHERRKQTPNEKKLSHAPIFAIPVSVDAVTTNHVMAATAKIMSTSLRHDGPGERQ
mmetsp:Transcript_6559/g.16988  ORF Transcript_6559/g.16988 Transcript_6559/m.16988 type:complete len:85 (+) Transcript_6559:432-686(+)